MPGSELEYRDSPGKSGMVGRYDMHTQTTYIYIAYYSIHKVIHTCIMYGIEKTVDVKVSVDEWCSIALLIITNTLMWLMERNSSHSYALILVAAPLYGGYSLTTVETTGSREFARDSLHKAFHARRDLCTICKQKLVPCVYTRARAPVITRADAPVIYKSACSSDLQERVLK